VDRNIVLSMILYAVLCAVPPVPVRVTGVLATLWFWCFALTLFLAEGMAVFRHHLQALAVGGIALAIGACLSMRREAARRREFLQALNAELAASELRRVNAELVRLMNTDVLTGVANRRRFDTAMRKAWDADGGAGEAPIGLLLADIDHFKALNDFAGHAHGDACLQAVAGAIQSAVGDGAATLARWGGEEFVILAPGLAYADLETLGETVRKAVLALQIPHPASPGTFVTISVGGAWCGKAAPCDSPDGLLRKADRALYAAKAGGRNCVVLEKEERMFFFEKKNQKTFAYGARACGRAKE
jgi:diguanylate cyclase (GGDEF)-like protein